MLVSTEEILYEQPFVDESELEGVVQQFRQILFGSATIYIPKTKIGTQGGANTIPDAIVIDLARHRWHVVEVELAEHGTWAHIVPQVSRQLVALKSSESRRRIIDKAI